MQTEQESFLEEVEALARKELHQENVRKAVERRKEILRIRQLWWNRIFPWRIHLVRVEEYSTPTAKRKYQVWLLKQLYKTGAYFRDEYNGLTIHGLERNLTKKIKEQSL